MSMEDAREQIRYIVERVQELRELAPAESRVIETSAGRLAPSNISKGDYDLIRAKLKSEGIVDISDSDRGLSWGENVARISIINPKKLDAYPDQIKKGSGGSVDIKGSSARDLKSLHDKIAGKCSSLYRSGNLAEAVEKGFKVVKDRLRELTNYEKATEAFGKGGLYVLGAAAPNVDQDFQMASKLLMMAIDFFRNEKSHTSDGNIDDPDRAYEYLAMSSLAMRLLDEVEIREHTPVEKEEKKHKSPKKSNDESRIRVPLSAIQLLALRVIASLDDKRLLCTETLGGSYIMPLGVSSQAGLVNELQEIDAQEVLANLEELAYTYGVLKVSFNRSGDPIFAPTKEGYDSLKQIETALKEDKNEENQVENASA